TEQRLGELAAAGTDQSGDPEDLAGVQVETDILEMRLQGERAHRQHRPTLRRKLTWIDPRQLPTHHHANERLACEVGGPIRADVAAVAQYRDLVCDLEQLVQAVCDVENTSALRFQLTDDREETLGVTLGERGGGLVHDEQRRFVRKCPRDL